MIKKKEKIFSCKNITYFFNQHLLCALKHPLKSVSESIFPLEAK